MPKQMVYTKEAVIEAAYELVKKEGMENINARNIAKALNSSVHPIFRHFQDMEELKKAVYEKIYDTYRKSMLSGMGEEKAYKKMGLSYIQFAKDYPEFFKMLFMQRTNLQVEDFVMADKVGNDVIKAGQELTHLDFEEQKKFHVKVWIFTHGMACLVATNTIQFTEKEMDELLEKTVLELLEGVKRREKKE